MEVALLAIALMALATVVLWMAYDATQAETDDEWTHRQW